MVPIGCLDSWGMGGLFFKNIRDDGHAVTDIQQYLGNQVIMRQRNKT